MNKIKKMIINKVDLYLLISVLILISYTVTIVVLVKMYPDLSESQVLTTLTTCVYGTFGLEIASCCVIKSLNIRNERLQMINEKEPLDQFPNNSSTEGGVG